MQTFATHVCEIKLWIPREEAKDEPKGN